MSQQYESGFIKDYQDKFDEAKNNLDLELKAAKELGLDPIECLSQHIVHSIALSHCCMDQFNLISQAMANIASTQEKLTSAIAKAMAPKPDFDVPAEEVQSDIGH